MLCYSVRKDLSHKIVIQAVFMKEITGIGLLVLLLTSCSQNVRSTQQCLSAANLESQYFHIDPTKNTRLQTAWGRFIS